MIIYAIGLHVLWAIIAYIDNSALQSTALAAVATIFGSLWTWLICITVAAMATLAFTVNRPFPRLLLMLPQQTVLLISAGGALEAIYLSQFADGVPRSRAFIAADQLPAVLAALCHSVAIVFATREAVV